MSKWKFHTQNRLFLSNNTAIEHESLSLVWGWGGAESRKKSYAKHFGYKLTTGLHLKKIEF